MGCLEQSKYFRESKKYPILCCQTSFVNIFLSREERLYASKYANNSFQKTLLKTWLRDLTLSGKLLQMMCFTLLISNSSRVAKRCSPQNHFLGRCVSIDVGATSPLTRLPELAIITWKTQVQQVLKVRQAWAAGHPLGSLLPMFISSPFPLHTLCFSYSLLLAVSTISHVPCFLFPAPFCMFFPLPEHTC